jgi:alkanesulfonate monooxygenase SsuD/methylene tetrahydromethanopterin reductase-like flavin-dependent oxidoreductase (luciferase family)
MSSPRVFISESVGADWTELTDSGQPAVRVNARDLQHAQRARDRIRDLENKAAGGRSAISVVLDVRVLIADDYRSAWHRIAELESGPRSVQYAGTLDGLAGLVDDIYAAGVADGVTLIPAVPHGDVRGVAEQTVARLKLLSRRQSGVPDSERSVPAAR